MTKTFKRLWLVFAFAIIFFAIVLSLFRGLTPLIGKYRPELEQRLSQMLGENVQIGTMQTGWYWFEPVLRLKNIEVTDVNQQKISLGQLFIGLDLPTSLWNWSWQPGMLAIDDLHVSIKQTADGWQMQGLSGSSQGIEMKDSSHAKWLMRWVLNQQQTRLRHAQIRLYLLDGSVLPFDDVNLLLQNHDERYTIKADAQMDQTTPTSIKLQGVLSIKDAQWHNAEGQLHLEVKDLLPGQWQSLIIPTYLAVVSGTADGQFWLQVKKGGLEEGQAGLAVKNLIVTNPDKDTQTFLQSFAANLFWKQDKESFRLSAEKMRMRMNSVQWPENHLSLFYNKAHRSTELRMHYFNVAAYNSIFSLGSAEKPDYLPAVMDGILQHVHLRWQHDQLQHFFARFSDLGWKAFSGWPDISGLNGVLKFDEAQGRVRVDSKDVVVQSPQKPPINMKLFATDLEWKKPPHKPFELNIHDLSVLHPNLELNAYGQAIKPNADSSPVVNLHGRFKVVDAEYWKPWLPRQHLKPKLYDWLLHDIKTLPHVIGSFVVQGDWQHFPFDNGQGQFRIDMAGEDVQLAIAPGWPVAHSVKGALSVQGRRLSGTISNGWFGQVLLKDLNFEVNKLGLDQEVLTLHTHIKSAAPNMIDYILQTPLQDHLKSLAKLKAEGEVGVDLHVKVPFFQGPEHIRVLGDLALQDNALTVAFDGLDLDFSHVKGTIQFDQKGIRDSQLGVDFWKVPIKVRMRSSYQDKPALLIDADFPLDVNTLEQQWKSPWWRLIKGSTQMQANMRITEDPDDLDRLQVRSNLQGLDIQLPPPFNKKAAASSPLELTIDFNSHQGFLVKTQWSKLLGTHLWFALKNGLIHLQKGEIRVGSTRASSQVDHGVQMLGHLDNFDDRQWQFISEIAFQQTSDASLWSNIDFVDLEVDKAHWFGQDMTRVNVQARQAQNIWNVHLKERVVKADLQWNARKNSVDMHMNRIQIPQVRAQRSSLYWPRLSPKNFPSINLSIDHLFSKTTDLGHLQLKGRSEQERWVLNDLKLDSPEYYLRARGQWQERQGKQESTVDMGLTSNKLSSILKRFGYPEVMQAKQGYISFKGKWPGPIYDPQVENITGDLAFTFKNGVISELSKETEEKIGLGKMLSIFSLQTIPRRLRLDFSDLSNSGYSFDKMEANFHLANGVLSTTDASVNGPVAHASVKGALNIKNRRCDLKLQVTPHITASLPVVATIAGGPIAGVAAWIVNKIISREMEKVSSYTYLVKGPGHNPKSCRAVLTDKSGNKYNILGFGHF